MIFKVYSNFLTLYDSIKEKKLQRTHTWTWVFLC